MAAEMVERVARALCVSLSETGVGPDDKVTDMDNKVVTYWTLWSGAAEAAIKAMQQPTEAMFMCGGNIPPSNQGRDHFGPRRSHKRIGDLAAKEAWVAMIDKALVDWASPGFRNPPRKLTASAPCP